MHQGEQDDEGKQKDDGCNSRTHRIISAFKPFQIHLVNQGLGRAKRTSLGKDEYRGRDEHGILDVRHQDEDQRGSNERELEIPENVERSCTFQISHFDQLFRHIAQSCRKQQEVEADIQVHACYDQQCHSRFWVIEPLDIGSEQMVDDADGGIEHHLDDHHRAGQPNCHGKKEENLVEGGKFSFPVGKQGGREADDDIGRNEEEGEAQGIGQAGLERLVSKESLVVFQSYELHAHSAEIDGMEAVEKCHHEGTIGEHHCKEQGGKHKQIRFRFPCSLLFHDGLSIADTTAFPLQRASQSKANFCIRKEIPNVVKGNVSFFPNKPYVSVCKVRFLVLAFWLWFVHHKGMYTDKNLGEQLLSTLDACNTQMQTTFASLLQPYNLTVVEYRALLILWKEDGLASKQLAQRLGKEGIPITPLVVGLEKKHFIERKENPKDARSACVFLTEKGRNTRIPARTLDGQLLACLQQSGALQEADLYTLLRLLDKALGSLRM